MTSARVVARGGTTSAETAPSAKATMLTLAVLVAASEDNLHGEDPADVEAEASGDAS